MRIIYQTQYVTDAHAVRAALLAAGIRATVSGEHAIDAVGGGLAVHVGEEADLEAVRAVLAAHAAAQPD